MSDFNQRIQKLINENKILVFVKGTKEEPMCGFSARVIEIFSRIGQPFAAHNILADDEARQKMKEFSNWPTFPQIYINGEFIGGCDIIIELQQSGELQTLVDLAFAGSTESAQLN